MPLGSRCWRVPPLLLAVASSPVLARRMQPRKSALYPNATRSEPKLDLTSAKDQKTLNEGLDAVNAGDDAKAKECCSRSSMSSKSKYAQALALQGLANIQYKAQRRQGRDRAAAAAHSRLA